MDIFIMKYNFKDMEILWVIMIKIESSSIM